MRARIEVAPRGASLEAMLLAGALDAYIGVEGVPPAFVGRDDVHRLFETHRSGSQDNHKLLFSLTLFEQWLRSSNT